MIVPLKLKVIRAVYETLEVKEAVADYSLPISSANLVYSLFSYLKNETREQLITLHLDTKNRLLCIDLVSVGTMSNSLIHPREVFKTALISSAASIVAVHNHPSGDPTPSRDDIAVTERLKKAGELIGIDLLDHIHYRRRLPVPKGTGICIGGIMTNTEMRQALRFLYHFQNLSRKAEDWEEAILVHLGARNASELSLGTFRAAIEDGKLVITRCPETDERQIDFLADYFCLEHEKGGLP